MLIVITGELGYSLIRRRTFVSKDVNLNLAAKPIVNVYLFY